MAETDNKNIEINAEILRTDKGTVEEKKKKLARIRQYREDKDTKEVLSLAAGKRLYHRLLEQCGATRTPFVVGDVYASHVNIGRQQIGLWLISEMERASPMAYSEMVRQAQSDALLSEKLDKEAEKEMQE
jgi:hypothetical protein